MTQKIETDRQQEIRALQKFKADKVMTPEEYAAVPIIGWHMVCKNFDGFGAIGIKYLGV